MIRRPATPETGGEGSDSGTRIVSLLNQEVAMVDSIGRFMINCLISKPILPAQNQYLF